MRRPNNGSLWSHCKSEFQPESLEYFCNGAMKERVREKREIKGRGKTNPSWPDLALSGISINFAPLINSRKYMPCILASYYFHSGLN